MPSGLSSASARYAAVIGLLAVGVAAFGSIFAPPNYLIAGGIGIVAGLVLAWIRLPRWFTPIGVVVVFLLLGPLATHRNDKPASLLPSPANLWEFVVLSVQAPYRIVTIDLTQVHAQFGLLAVPYLVAFVAALAAGYVMRRGLIEWALGITTIPLILALALGARAADDGPLVGAGFAVAAAVLLVAVHTPIKQSFWARLTRLILAAVVLIATGAAGFGIASLAHQNLRAGSVRSVIHGDPKPYDYSSPLTELKRFHTDLKSTTLFTVTGMPAGERMRTATLDRYDGTSYHPAGSTKDNPVSGQFAPYQDVNTTAALDTRLPLGNTVSAHVQVEDYSDVWVPGPTHISWFTCTGTREQDILDGLYLNPITGTAMTTSGLRRGDTYNVGGTLAIVPGDDELANAEFAKILLPNTGSVPPELFLLAQSLVTPDQKPIDKVRAIQAYLQQHGQVYNGDTAHFPSGHSGSMLARFVTTGQFVGDDEQFATTMAIMALTAGIPARVATGFQVAPDRKTITGADARAWVEVAFDGIGWVPFEATPSRDHVPPITTDVPPIASPPSPDKSQDTAPPPPEQQPDKAKKNDNHNHPDTPKSVLTVVGDALLGLLILLAEALAILAVPCLIGGIIAWIKIVRRRRRRHGGSPVQRIAAAWDEVTDTLIDLGMPRLDGCDAASKPRRSPDPSPRSRAWLPSRCWRTHTPSISRSPTTRRPPRCGNTSISGARRCARVRAFLRGCAQCAVRGR